MHARNWIQATLISALPMLSGPVGAEPPAGSAWIDPTTGMEFVYLPGGCFNMGAADGSGDEQPLHRVCVKGFYIGRYEVTQAQYKQLVDRNPSHFKGPNRPVEQVNWDDARNMVVEMSAVSGHKYRLPTEAEWEYACRAGGQHDPFCGTGGANQLAWFEGNSAGQTHDVGQKRPNAWGIYDMSGNVWEWTQDCWHPDYSGAPKDGSAWVSGEDTDCSRRISRGGGWLVKHSSIRAAQRSRVDFTVRCMLQGFRIVRSP